MLYKIAVASSDGIMIDTHFGHANNFYIYQVEDTDASFSETEVRQVAAYCGNENCGGSHGKNTVEALRDVDFVLCAKIGPHAIRQLDTIGVRAYDIVLPIAEAIPKINDFRRRIQSRKVSPYDFNHERDRRGTSSLKFDFGRERAGREDLLPLWVADMDFALPEEILTPLRRRLNHGIFGYTDPKEEDLAPLFAWYESRHHFSIPFATVTAAPGIVYAIATAIRAFTDEGDAVLIQQPVYYPFSETITDNGRALVNNELIEVDGKYQIDFKDFEQQITDHNVRFFLLCSPHNPVGRVWSREELHQIASICAKHHVIVFADEIHCDFIYPGNTFHPFAPIAAAEGADCIIGISPSKTFNMAGLQFALTVIFDEKLRLAYRRANAAAGYSQCSALGLYGANAAYTSGGAWFDALLSYLTDNVAFVRRFIKEQLPDIRLIEPEGTYLLWLDCKKIAPDKATLHRIIEDDALLWLDHGDIFGANSQFYERINIATPRHNLHKALTQLKGALS